MSNHLLVAMQRHPIIYVPAGYPTANQPGVATVYPYGSPGQLRHVAKLFRQEGLTNRQITHYGFPAAAG